jgi:hypothetical protein
MKKVKVTKRMLEAYVQKILAETEYRQITTTPTSTTTLPGFIYMSGGDINTVFKPALDRSLTGGETSFGNIGEQIITGLKNQFFDAGNYEAVVVNEAIQVGSGKHTMTIGGQNFVNSDVVFVPKTGAILNYDKKRKTLKIDLALMSSKLTHSPANESSPCNNPFSFSNFKEAVSIIINAAMGTAYYAEEVTTKNNRILKFELKAGGLCGNFYNFSDMQQSQIPNDHDVKMRYIFYSLDPEDNYNVQVLPAAASASSTPAIDNLEKGETKKLSQLTRDAITSVWNSITIGTDRRARFMNFRDHEAALSTIFGTPDVMDWPISSFFYRDRGIFTLTNNRARTKSSATLPGLLDVLGLGNTTPNYLIDGGGIPRAILYRAILGSLNAIGSFTANSDVVEQIRKLRYRVNNTSGETFTSTSASDIQVLNSAGKEYITGETTQLSSAELEYFKVNTKRYPIELNHNSDKIKNRILQHIEYPYPGYTATFTSSKPPTPGTQFGTEVEGPASQSPGIPSILTTDPFLVNQFIDELEKQITVRKNQPMNALGQPGLRATNLSNFVSLLQQTKDAYSLFVEMMAVLKQHAEYQGDITGQTQNTSFKQVMTAIRQNTDSQKNEEIVGRLLLTVAQNRFDKIESYNLFELVKIFLPNIETLEEFKKLTSFDEIERETLPGLEASLFDNALKIELVNAYYDSEDKGKALAAVKNIIKTATDIANAHFNTPANQPFPEPALAVAESRLYESILQDLIAVSAKNQRVANQPKKIKITKQKLNRLLREFFK